MSRFVGGFDIVYRGQPIKSDHLMVSALYLLVDNHGKPTQLGYSGEWSHAIFFKPIIESFSKKVDFC